MQTQNSNAPNQTATPENKRFFRFSSQFSVQETVARLQNELARKGIQLFAQFDHAENARQAGLTLRPTAVLVFGSPKVGTELMRATQSICLELPLKIAVWEDETGHVWTTFPRMDAIAEEYGLRENKILQNMANLLAELAKTAGGVS